jgi:serine/threonine-protein kinase
MICSVCNSQNEDTAETCFTCGQPLAAVITRGTLVARRYEILSPLGRGGMGMVYKAHDRVLDETVALKVLRADIAQDPDMARRFRSEIRLARRVRHKNVCGIHEYGEDGRVHFIAMEFIEGIDLKKILKQSRVGLRSDEAFEVAIQVAEGLQAIHDAGIIHRDLKTPNIMRDAKGCVRLMDFGIAKESDAASGQTATGLIVGTPEYMSPEQARGERVDSRTDIYALGIVIFEIFTGEVPFHGETPLATILKHLKDPPPVEVMDAHHLPFEVRDVLSRALAKEPKDRFQTAANLADALRQARATVQGQEAVSGTRMGAPADRVGAPTTAMRTPLPQHRVTPTPTPSARMAVRPVPPPGRPARTPRGAGTTGAARYRTRQTPVWLFALPVVALAVIAGAVLAVWPTTPAEEAQPGADALKGDGSATLGTPPPAASAGPEVTLAPPAPLEPSPAATPIAPTPPPATPAASPASPASAPSPRASHVPAPSLTPAAATASALPMLPIVRQTPSPPATPAATRGDLWVVVTPWADVSLDGQPLGSTPLRTSVEPGRHDLVLTHPEYEPVRRKVTITVGTLARIDVDLSQDAIRKQ